MARAGTWPLHWPQARHEHAGASPALLEVVTDRDRIGELWTAVEKAVGADVLAASWDWTDTWLQHYGDVVPHRAVVAHGPAGPNAIALLTRGVHQRRGPLPVRTVHLGTAGEPPGSSVCVEYNRILVAPQHRAAFSARLVDVARHGLGRWDVFELNGFAPEDAAAIVAVQPAFRVAPRVCHVADLAAIRAAGSDVVAALGSNVAAKIRKNVRRFTERYGELSGRWIADSSEAEAAFDELIALHQARWHAAGQPGSFSDARFAAFHRALIRRLLPSGRVVLYRVTAGEQVIGTFYGFIERGAIYHYQWGLAHFDDNALAPGFVVGALCMQEALERGYAELNWLAGDIRYKRELSTTQRELLWATWERGPWIRSIRALIALRHRLRPRAQS